jgi:hypothetical protein
MALDPEEIARRIRRLGTDLPQNLGEAIQRAADIAIAEASARTNFKKNTPIKGVRDSMMAQFDTSTLTLGIFMPAHGYFQNFGVIGKKITGTLGLDESTAAAFGVSPGYQFKFGTENGHPGLPAKNFLDIASFTTQVAKYVEQNLEL